RCCEEEAWTDPSIREDKVWPHLSRRRDQEISSRSCHTERRGAMRCVSAEGAGSHQHQSKRRSLSCAISIARDCRFAGGTSLASLLPSISPATCCFGSLPTPSRPIDLVIWMPRPSSCSSRLRRKVRLRLPQRTWPGWTRDDLLRRPGPSLFENGTG